MALSRIETGSVVAMRPTQGMYDRIHFAVMAIESAARKMHVLGRKMHAKSGMLYANACRNLLCFGNLH